MVIVGDAISPDTRGLTPLGSPGSEREARMTRRDPSSQTDTARFASGTSRRKGTVVVQMAFVVPVFFIFVFGLIELGRGFMVLHLLNNAARDGCRKGVVVAKSNTDITNTINSLMSAQGISGHTTTVKVNDVVKDVSTAASNDEVTVTVSVPVANITWLPGGQSLTGTLTGRYSLRRE